ncbi:adenosylcobinamide-GDP ribazoletransferase [Parabacteroides sp. Marseille-P3160]|uniref:adenosylcobinamide-GDP ribazoletransferase n=1 Tax=Parabacteroides sp. Marseille-P3160 TaxID=1917887 RepID=UPI0009BA55F3|nr:adenosylcobinamide-GDP ribazoletransferase [Parabacteroides sp. Marseille-P3160]
MVIRVMAALQFFTRLPLWRFVNIPADHFRHVVPYWALTGWLTAAVSTITLLVAVYFLPLNIAIILAMISRLLLTGCLHEDGLADFLDGFGGGHDRAQILSIMKDSHIGSYGVIGLISYFILYYLLLNTLPAELIASTLLMGDPFSKGVASMIINKLPYARKEEESKSKMIYTSMTRTEWIIAAVSALLPLIWVPSPLYLIAVVFPVAIWFGFTNYIKKRINGYTGDCCGALFLLCEIGFYLGVVIIYNCSNSL